jgi:hypothetical protein
VLKIIKPGNVVPPQSEVVAENLAYLEKTQSKMQYPQIQAQGWPIGRGIVENADKLMVEARMKGAGMHWKRENVDPTLALRNIICSDRWTEERLLVIQQLRWEAKQRSQALRQRHRLTKALLLKRAPITPIHGAKFKFKDPATWSEPAHCFEMLHPDLGHIRVRIWNDLHFRKAAKQPMTVACLERLESKGSRRLPNTIWVAWICETPPKSQTWWQRYMRRYAVDHWYRFAKQRMYWTLPMFSTPEHGER